MAVGLLCAHDLSTELGLASGQDRERVRAHLTSLGLATDLSAFPDVSFDKAALKATMAKDKKVQAGTIRFVLTHGIGQAFVSDGVSDEALDRVLDRLL